MASVTTLPCRPCSLLWVRCATAVVTMPSGISNSYLQSALARTPKEGPNMARFRAIVVALCVAAITLLTGTAARSATTPDGKVLYVVTQGQLTMYQIGT